VLEDIGYRETNAHAPQMLEVAHESGSVIYGWTCFRISAGRARDGGIGRTCGIRALRTIGAINADPTLPYLDGSLDGV
jgi:hypothetical protein